MKKCWSEMHQFESTDPVESKFNIEIKNEVENIEEMQEVHSAVQPIWIKEESQEISTSNDHYQDPLTEFYNGIKKENT